MAVSCCLRKAAQSLDALNLTTVAKLQTCTVLQTLSEKLLLHLHHLAVGSILCSLMMDH